METLLGVCLVYSGVFAVLFTLDLVVGRLFAVDAAISNYPPAIAERFLERNGGRSARGPLADRLMAFGTLLLLVGVPVFAMRDVADRTGETPGFVEGFVLGLVMFLVLNVFDLLVLDWWLFCTVTPRWLVLPGTEGMAEYKDRAFHYRVLIPRPIPWPLLWIPGYGVAVGGGTALVTAVL